MVPIYSREQLFPLPSWGLQLYIFLPLPYGCGAAGEEFRWEEGKDR